MVSLYISWILVHIKYELFYKNQFSKEKINNTLGKSKFINYFYWKFIKKIKKLRRDSGVHRLAPEQQFFEKL